MPELEEKKVALAQYLEMFAQDIATVGFMIRTGDDVKLETIYGFTNDIAYIVYGCLELGLRCKQGFAKNLGDISAELERGDFVALADTLEYELLTECENLIKYLK